MITVGIYLAFILVQAITALSSLAIASRYLNQDAFVLWSIGSATFGYVSLLDAGASMIVQRNVAAQRPDLVRDAETTGKTFFLVVGAAGLMVFTIGAAMPGFIYVSMIGSMMIRVAANVFGAILIGNGAIISDRICRMSSSAVLLLSQYLLLSNGVGVAAWSLSVLIAAGVYLIVLVALSSNIRRILIHGSIAVHVFAKYRDQHFNWLLYMTPVLFIYNFQTFALKLWATPEAVAVFAAAHQLYFSAISVCAMTRVLSSVVISKHHYAKSSLRNKAIFASLRANAMLVSLALALVSALLVPIGHLLFPAVPLEKYWMVFAIYGFFLVLEAAQNALADALISAGETDFKRVAVSSALLNVIGCYLLVPNFGVLGAVVAVCVAQLITCNCFNVVRAIRVFSLPSLQVVRIIFVSMIAYSALVMIHVLAHEIGVNVGWAADALVVLGVMVFGVLRLLPGVFSIVGEYNRSKVQQRVWQHEGGSPPGGSRFRGH